MAMHAQKARGAKLPGVAHVAGRLMLALVIFLSGYLLAYRPQEVRLGATDAEVARAMPGDAIQPHPNFNATRALTIHAQPEHIWPWLAQIGYGRAGWYGYDWIDNDGIPSADHIIPQYQQIKVGDTIQIMKGVNFKVVALDPDHYLVWASPEGGYSMAMALYPLDATHTRLVWRIRGAYDWTSPTALIPQLFSDLADGIAVRQNMLGVKARTEGIAPVAPAIIYTELAFWLAAFLGFLVAEAGLVTRRDWLRPLLAVAASGLGAVGLVLAKPPLWIDALVVICLWAGVCWIYWPMSRFTERLKELSDSGYRLGDSSIEPEQAGAGAATEQKGVR